MAKSRPFLCPLAILREPPSGSTIAATLWARPELAPPTISDTAFLSSRSTPYFGGEAALRRLISAVLGGRINNAGFAINELEQVVGASDLPGDQFQHAFLWQHGVITRLGNLAGRCCERRDRNQQQRPGDWRFD